jgi:N-methylhydantoinase B/oxoprolinase/acetone carboxylase alpha subunit
MLRTVRDACEPHRVAFDFSPNEQVEAKFPLVVERYAIVPDSGLRLPLGRIS